MNDVSTNPAAAPVQPILPLYTPITLREMDAVELMDRFDTKFIFPAATLGLLLDGLRSDYRALEVNGVRGCRYENRYFDTPGHSFFLDHHNAKANRLKVRFRKYVDSGVAFFEVKCKTNKGKTVKQRIPCSGIPQRLDDTHRALLASFLPAGTIDRLQPSLDNAFTRITLVNNAMADRFTIDTDVSFDGYTGRADLHGLVIAELKQQGPTVRPFLRDLFSAAKMQRISVSKYAIGSLLLHPELKHNNFKGKLHLLDKLRHAA